MSNCPSCGAALREGARFCPGCGAAVGAPQPASTSGPPGKAAPGVAKQPMLVGPPPPSPALAPPPPLVPPPPTGPRTLPIALAAGAVVALMVIAVGAFLLAGEDPATTEPNAQGSGADAADDAAGEVTDPPSESSSATTPAPTTPPPTTASLSSPRGMSGTWVAVFISYYTEQEAQAYLSEAPPGSQVLQSDGYSSLRPGYWIVYNDGGFDTGREAADFCRSVGRTSPQDCFARFLTTDPDASPTDPDLNVDP